MKRICRYLRGTLEKGIQFDVGNDLTLNCYADADFAGLWGVEDSEDSICVKSRTGYLITIGNCPLLWVSKLQTEVALSTLEAEYIALSQSMRDLLPMRRLVQDVSNVLGIKGDLKTKSTSTAFEDNQGAIGLANSPKLSPRTKHIAVKYHFFRENIAKGEISIEKIDTTLQKADLLTKGLPADKFERLRKLLMGW